MIYVKSERLCGRSIQLGDEQLENADAMPFFDPFGKVKVVVILTSDGRIRGVCPHRHRVRTPWFGPLKIDADLLELQEPEVGILDGLWHFDAGWRLNRPEFNQHPLKAWIKETNCVKQFRINNVSETMFRRNLRAVSWVLLGDQGSEGVKSYRADQLPPAPKQEVVEGERLGTQWRLRPFWQPVG